MSSNNSLYADLILPLALPNLYTYKIPDNLINNIKIGQAVIVQFGRKKLYSAIVKNIHNNKPQYQTKEIEDIVQPELVINKYQLKLWDWIKDYYLAYLGEIYKAAVPSGLKLESETIINLNKSNFEDIDIKSLTDDEQILLNKLSSENKAIYIKDAEKLLNKKNIINLINSLLDKGIINISENINNKYKAKVKKIVKLNAEYFSEEAINKCFDKLKRAPKQHDILLAYITLSNLFTNKIKEVEQKELLNYAKADYQALKALVNKGIFYIEKQNIDRIKYTGEIKEISELNKEQNESLNEIKKQFETKNTVLLFGITGSGKTEIYIKLIKEQIDKGKQVLYLLPEIAITPQITLRLQSVFGNRIGVYHSKFNDNERTEVWRKLEQKEYDIILGVRSSIFLPFTNLGLIIVDEEHESTYKQYNPSPRYNARDTAIVLASFFNAKTILGTATPSVETYYNALSKKYGLVKLNKRYGNAGLPEIIIYDIKEARRKKQMKSVFSPLLVSEIQKSLDNKKQVILFQNRRGFAPFIECKDCGWVPYCENCDVSLTYHKHKNHIVCHYCGYSTTIPSRCKACGGTNMTTIGSGTEKIEDEISLLFPNAIIDRLDVDSTSKKNAHEKIIHNFQNGDIDILIGTQMVTKGLDFKNVNLVGVINADEMINFPDFRAYERTFQLLTQVSGRAGRSEDKGKVIIQTSSPKHPLLKFIVSNNFDAFFSAELEDRQEYMYPPFYKLVKITVKHRRQNITEVSATLLAKELKLIFGKLLLGPEDALISRIKNSYIKEIFIKIPRNKSLKQAKQLILDKIHKIQEYKEFKYVKILIDVDPY